MAQTSSLMVSLMSRPPHDALGRLRLGDHDIAIADRRRLGAAIGRKAVLEIVGIVTLGIFETLM